MLEDSGSAEKLYEAFVAQARQYEATAVQAITTPGNSTSIAFHTAIGFRGELVKDYAGPEDDRVLFEMTLLPER